MSHPNPMDEIPNLTPAQLLRFTITEMDTLKELSTVPEEKKTRAVMKNMEKLMKEIAVRKETESQESVETSPFTDDSIPKLSLSSFDFKTMMDVANHLRKIDGKVLQQVFPTQPELPDHEEDTGTRGKRKCCVAGICLILNKCNKKDLQIHMQEIIRKNKKENANSTKRDPLDIAFDEKIQLFVEMLGKNQIPLGNTWDNIALVEKRYEEFLNTSFDIYESDQIVPTKNSGVGESNNVPKSQRVEILAPAAIAPESDHQLTEQVIESGNNNDKGFNNLNAKNPNTPDATPLAQAEVDTEVDTPSQESAEKPEAELVELTEQNQCELLIRGKLLILFAGVACQVKGYLDYNLPDVLKEIAYYDKSPESVKKHATKSIKDFVKMRQTESKRSEEVSQIHALYGALKYVIENYQTHEKIASDTILLLSTKQRKFALMKRAEKQLLEHMEGVSQTLMLRFYRGYVEYWKDPSKQTAPFTEHPRNWKRNHAVIEKPEKCPSFKTSKILERMNITADSLTNLCFPVMYRFLSTLDIESDTLDFDFYSLEKYQEMSTQKEFLAIEKSFFVGVMIL